MCCSKLRYKHASFGNMLWVECGFYFTYDENFLNHVQLMDLVARRDGYVEGVGYLNRRGQKPLIRKTVSSS